MCFGRINSATTKSVTVFMNNPFRRCGLDSIANRHASQNSPTLPQLPKIRLAQLILFHANNLIPSSSHKITSTLPRRKTPNLFSFVIPGFTTLTTILLQTCFTILFTTFTNFYDFERPWTLQTKRIWHVSRNPNNLRIGFMTEASFTSKR